MKPKNNPKAAAETETAQSMEHVPQRQLRNYARLAKIDLIKAAQIAATLRRHGEDEIEAVRSTYTLLDIFLHCQDSLVSEASVEAGIKRYQEGVNVDEEFYAALVKSNTNKRNAGRKLNIVEQLLEHGPEGKKEPIDFDKALETAIPLPKSTRNKPAERRTRLKRFLKEWLQETRPEMNEQDRILEAAEQIERMSREGIEPKFSAFIKVRFPSWWAEAQAQDDSANGRLGQAVKKGKQVQVKPASNKRKARPPVDKLPEAIHQLIKEDKSQDLT